LAAVSGDQFCAQVISPGWYYCLEWAAAAEVGCSDTLLYIVNNIDGHL
jgi:hypothetical protein